MLYNDTTNKNGVCQEIDSICKSDTNSYPLADKNRRINSAEDDFVNICLTETGWTVEDSNKTDIPIATSDLDSGVATYAFPTELLTIKRLVITDSTGNKHELTPVDSLPVIGSTGLPTQYKKIGNSFILYPTPNFTVSDGIELEYERAFTHSTVSGSTFTPSSSGIPSTFHMWLARKASMPYLIENMIASKNDIFTLIEKDEARIVDYLGSRSKESPRARLTIKQESNK